jgi:hypothetical protein
LNHNLTTVPLVGYPDSGPKGQVKMGGSEFVAIKSFTVRGCFAMITIPFPVPTGETFLFHLDIGTRWCHNTRLLSASGEQDQTEQS